MDVRMHLGNYLKAADVDNQLIVTVAAAHSKRFDDGDKIILAFEESVNPLPLNKTNLTEMVEMFGSETAAWLGCRIRVFRDKTTFAGKKVDCLRVGPAQPGDAPGQDSLPF